MITPNAAVLKRLNDTEQEYVLACFSGETFDQIAERYEVSRSRVENVVGSAIKKCGAGAWNDLRRMLEQIDTTLTKHGRELLARANAEATYWRPDRAKP